MEKARAAVVAAAVAGAFALTGTVAGCSANDPVYFPSGAVLDVDGSGTAAMQTFALNFRTPTASEQKAIDDETAKVGYQVPWLREDRLHIEMRYTVKNLGDTQAGFSLNIDGASEFVRYDEDAVLQAFTDAGEKTTPLGLMVAVDPPILAPGQVFQGLIREDDFHEAALDLDALGRWMANYTAVLINRSEMSNIGLVADDGTPLLPPNLVLPALWEITPRFNSTQPMELNFLIRVRDDDNRLWKNGDAQFMPNPMTFMPVVMKKAN